MSEQPVFEQVSYFDEIQTFREVEEVEEKDIHEILNFQDAVEFQTISIFPEVNFQNALIEIERSNNIFYYEQKRQFTLRSISILEEVGDYYLFTIPLTEREDIFTNFQSNIKFKITYDDYYYPDNNYFNTMLIKILTPLTKQKITFYIDKNDLPENFYIKYRVYLLPLEKRKELAVQSYRSKIIAGNCVYWKGSIFRFF